MANPKHLEILDEGIVRWNEWRRTPEGFKAAIDFSEAELEDCRLTKGRLFAANFTKANLTLAEMQEANIATGLFTDASLNCADLTGANLAGADFTGTDIDNAIFDGADLRNVTGLILNGNSIRGTRFSPSAPDPWSVLRRNYTGPKMAFVLLLSMLYFGPLAARTILLVSLSHGQHAA